MLIDTVVSLLKLVSRLATLESIRIGYCLWISVSTAEQSEKAPPRLAFKRTAKTLILEITRHLLAVLVH